MYVLFMIICFFILKFKICYFIKNFKVELMLNIGFIIDNKMYVIGVIILWDRNLKS